MSLSENRRASPKNGVQAVHVGLLSRWLQRSSYLHVGRRRSTFWAFEHHPNRVHAKARTTGESPLLQQHRIGEAPPFRIFSKGSSSHSSCSLPKTTRSHPSIHPSIHPSHQQNLGQTPALPTHQSDDFCSPGVAPKTVEAVYQDTEMADAPGSSSKASAAKTGATNDESYSRRLPALV